MKRILLKNGKIYTMDKKDIIERGDILIENGKIVGIGENILIEDADTYDLEGNHVFPGFIEAHCHLGLSEQGITSIVDSVNEKSNPVTPELNPIDGINPSDIGLKEAYENGITTVGVAPGSSNIIAGQFAVIKTFGTRIDDMVVEKVCGMKISLGENPISVYGSKGQLPNTRMAVASKLRETILKTEKYLEERESGHSKFDIRLEAMAKVVEGKIPLRVHAHRADDIFTAIRIANEFDIGLILEHCTEGHLIHEYLAEDKFPAIVGPGLTDKSKYEIKNLTFKTAKVLLEAGIKVAITTDSPEVPIKYLPICAGLTVREGLKEYEAIKTITINPAEILGIENRVGSITIGKDADIAVFNGNPLRDIYSENILTIIDGKIVSSRGSEKNESNW